MSTTHETLITNVLTKQDPQFKAMARKLGARLRLLRETKALTLERAAEQCGMNWRVIQRVESGTSNVTLGTLFRICIGLQIDIEDIFAASQVDHSDHTPR